MAIIPYTYLASIKARSFTKPFYSIRAAHNYFHTIYQATGQFNLTYDRLRHFISEYNQITFQVGTEEVKIRRTRLVKGVYIDLNLESNIKRVFLVECWNDLGYEKICQHMIKAESKEQARKLFYQFRNDLSQEYTKLQMIEQPSISPQPGSNL